MLANDRAREGVETSVRISTIEEQVEPGDNLISAKQILALIPDNRHARCGAREDQPASQGRHDRKPPILALFGDPRLKRGRLQLRASDAAPHAEHHGQRGTP